MDYFQLVLSRIFAPGEGERDCGGVGVLGGARGRCSEGLRGGARVWCCWVSLAKGRQATVGPLFSYGGVIYVKWDSLGANIWLGKRLGRGMGNKLKGTTG